MTSVSATIHIVHDDESFRTSTGRLLRACGYAVEIYAGHADVLTAVHVIKAGADDLLTKPINKDTLVGAIERALARRRRMQASHEQPTANRDTSPDKGAGMSMTGWGGEVS